MNLKQLSNQLAIQWVDYLNDWDQIYPNPDIIQTIYDIIGQSDWAIDAGLDDISVLRFRQPVETSQPASDHTESPVR